MMNSMLVAAITDLCGRRHGGTDRPGRASRSLSRAGFTMLELIIILTVVSLLMTIMVSRIDTRRFQLDTAAKEVRSAMTAARGKALLKQHDMVLTFDGPGDRLYVLEDENNNGVTDSGEERRMVQLPDEVKIDRGGAPAINGKTDAISFAQVTEALPSLTFHRSGSASEEGILYITSARAAGGTVYPQDARALMLERSTGRVVCLSYRTAQWVEGC